MFRTSGIVCKRCGEAPDEATKFLLCSVCRGVHYCSVECQRVDWKLGHKKDCQVLVAMNKAFGSGHDDAKKWIDRNRLLFMVMVGEAVAC